MDDAEYIFGDGGILAEHLPGFKARRGQVELARAVLNSLEKERHLLAEAPTGTGKSLASGIPAAIQAMGLHKTVVYVTANITLQEQLIQKDMPLIRDLLQDIVEDKTGELVNFRFALLKGISNYLCLANLQLAKKEFKDSSGHPDWLKEIVDWSAKTKTGDKSELTVEYGNEIWSKVSTPADECLKSSCPLLNKCFAIRARQEAKEAHLVVTNYHMWFADMSVRNATAGKFSYLPDHKIVIMDEAHEAPEIAMDFHGFQITEARIKWALRALSESERFKSLYTRISIATKNFFEARRTDGVIETPMEKDFGLIQALRDGGVGLQVLASSIGDPTEAGLVRQSKLLARAGMAQQMADGLAKVVFGVVYEKDGSERLGSIESVGTLPVGATFFFEKQESGLELRCKAVNVQPFFRREVFGAKVAILTSATLKTNYAFDFIVRQFGLEKDEFDTVDVPSPFSPDRVFAMVPNDFPDPSNKEAHAGEIAKTLKELRPQLKGGILCLFTSHYSVSAVASSLRKWKLDVKYPLFVQGEQPKSQIIQNFKAAFEEGKHAILLGTSSFWQGVDIPGQALGLVAIDKIPFPRPDDPILCYLELRGSNSFMEYSIPKAIISTKQGIGRLIRRETDFGVVVLFDRRFLTKPWGKQFRCTFPNGCYFHDGPLKDGIDTLKEFLEDQYAESQSTDT